MHKIKKAPNLVGMVLCDPGRTEFKLFGGYFINYMKTKNRHSNEYNKTRETNLGK